MLSEKQILEFINFSHKVADAVGDVHRKYYRQPVSTEYKDDSSPVTQVDKESEIIVRDMIISQFPDHGIQGEEFPPHQPDAEFVWVIDPVDGTKYFMIGQPAFAFLLALAYQNEFILGVIDQAITRERWIGANHYGSFLNSRAVSTRKIIGDRPRFIDMIKCGLSPFLMLIFKSRVYEYTFSRKK